MSISRITFLFIIILSTQQMIADSLPDVARYVNPFIGTGKYTGPSLWGHYGGVYPGAVLPFGLVQATPETRLSGDPLGYYYEDDRINAFSLAGHMSGYPSGSAGVVKFMPFFDSEGDGVISSSFSHNQEWAEPGYYSVELYERSLLTELTVTERSAFVRLTTRKSFAPDIYFLDAEQLQQVNAREIKGKCGGYYFYVRFDRDIKSVENRRATLVQTDDQNILFKIAVSRTSEKNARLNLEAENNDWDFEQIKKQAREKWNSHLSKIEINGGDCDHLTVFYTALYHSMLLPFVASDVHGEYRGADGNVHHCQSGHFYAGFSPWDTFRTLHPLLTLLQPQRQLDMVKSLLLMYQQNGRLYDGPMTGNHAIPIIVDSYVKGVNDFDVNLAAAAITSSIVEPPFLKKDFSDYVSTGFVPADLPESVTRTLEYAYNDWTAAEYFKKMDPPLSDLLMRRSLNYQNLLRAETGLMSPKFKDGSWSSKGGYKEGDAWNYSWFVPHDVRGLINMMGGDEHFVRLLENGYVESKIIHDNEPVLNFAYLFNYAGAPWKTQERVSELRRLYSSTPGGIPGNDDLGSMSSWYVFSALGLFPVCPGRPVYDLTSPLFSDVVIHLQDGKKLSIKAERTTEDAMFIGSVQLNEKKLVRPWIMHSEIVDGGELLFQCEAASENAFPFSHTPSPALTKTGPRFDITDFRVTDTTVLPNQMFEAIATIANSSSRGGAYLRLFIDDVPVDSALFIVDSGNKIDARFKCRLYSAGPHNVRIDQLPPKSVIVSAEKHQARVHYSNFSFDPLVRIGENLNISLTVKNIGAFDKNKVVSFYVDDNVVDQKTVNLAPGEERSVQFSLSDLPSGVHRHSINDSLNGKFRVYEHALESCLLDLSFDDNKYPAKDNSGFDNQAFLVGDVKIVDGKVGNGIRTGKNGYVDIAESPSLNISGKTMSILAWIKPEYEGVADFVSKGDYNVLKMQNQTTLNFIAGGWGRGECMASVPEDWNNQWHHLAGIYDDDELRLYVDGELLQTLKVSGELAESEFPWNIGRNAEIPYGRSTKGLIDEVKIFREALSRADIQKILKSSERVQSREKR